MSLKNALNICHLLLLLALIMFPSVLLSAETDKIPKRSEIDDKYKWNLEKMYPTVEDWEKDFEYVKSNYSHLENYKGRLGESADILLE